MHYSYLANTNTGYTGSYEGLSAILIICLVTALFMTVVLIIVSPLILIASLIRRKAVAIAQERMGTVIAQYDPPYDLKPAEMGCLYDMKIDEKERYATLFDLEQKNIIQINSKNSVNILDRERYMALEEFEKIAVRMFDPATAEQEKLSPADMAQSILFSNGAQKDVTEIQLSNKSKTAFNAAVRTSLLRKGFRIRHYDAWVFMLSLLAGLLLSLAPTLGILIASIFSTNSIIEIFNNFVTGLIITLILDLFAWPVLLIFGYLTVKIVQKLAGVFWINSKDARKAWPTIEGYKIFLKQTDLDDIQSQSRDKSPKYLETAPYAMVLHLNTDWKERFK